MNDEIAALVRAGVPLDRGLLRAGGDLPGGLKRITQALGDRLSRGESLAQALEAEKGSIPPLYRAVVEAGARSGRLPAALEGLARYVRGYSEARAAIGVALWYPILVLSLAYALFLGLVIEVIPGSSGPSSRWGSRSSRPCAGWSGSGSWPPTGGRSWPILLVLLGIAWWRSGIAASFQTSSWSLIRLFPWMRSMLSDYESAGFAELTALLLEHQVPLPQAVMLSAEATGNAAMIEGARQLAAAVERGEPAGEAVRERPDRVVPPLAPLGARGGAGTGLAGRVAPQPGADVPQTRGVPGREAPDFPADPADARDRRLGHLLYALTLFIPLSTMLRDWPGLDRAVPARSRSGEDASPSQKSRDVGSSQRG